MPGCTVPLRYLANMLQNMFLLGSCKWKWKRPISPIYTYLSFCVGTFVVWCIAKFLHKFFYPLNQPIVLSILFLYLENIVLFCCNILDTKKYWEGLVILFEQLLKPSQNKKDRKSFKLHLFRCLFFSDYSLFIGFSHTFRIYFRPLLFLSLTSQITPHIVPYTF